MKSIIALAFLAFACAILLEAVSESSDADGELLNLQFVFRHGDRTPKSLYKKDPYKNFQWPEGLAQLTAKGKQRMYEYGKVIRKRYSSYIGKIFFQKPLFI